MNKYCFLNGEIIDSESACVPIDDIGLLRGYGVFEVIKTYNKKPFLLSEHLDRLEASANYLGITIPNNREEIVEIIDKLIGMSFGSEFLVRIVLTGGRSVSGMDFNGHNPNFFITLADVPVKNEEQYTNGVSLCLVEHQRFFPTVKTLNYVFPIKLKQDIKDGYFDFLYHFNGYVLESPTSSFFLVKGDKIITPKDNVLMGVTRGFVIKIASEMFQVEERDVLLEEINSADECFITATNKEVLPVVKIDDIVIGNGLVGEKTKKIIEKYNQIIQNV